MVVRAGRLLFCVALASSVRCSRTRVSQASTFRLLRVPTAASRQNRTRVNFRNAFRSPVVWGVSCICIPTASQSPRRFSYSRSQKYWLSVFCLTRTAEILPMHHHALCCCFRVHRGKMSTRTRIGFEHSGRPDVRPPAPVRIYAKLDRCPMRCLQSSITLCRGIVAARRWHQSTPLDERNPMVWSVPGRFRNCRNSVAIFDGMR